MPQKNKKPFHKKKNRDHNDSKKPGKGDGRSHHEGERSFQNRDRFRRPGEGGDFEMQRVSFDVVLLKNHSEQEMSLAVAKSQQRIRQLTGVSESTSLVAPLTAPIGGSPGRPHSFAPSRSYKEKSQWQVKDQNQRPATGQKAPEIKIKDMMKDIAETAAKPSAESNKRSLDEWQQKAFEALKVGRHVIVDAPTSAGKTRVIEAFIDDKFAKNEPLRLVYTTPVKSLSNDKYREFCERYGSEKIGINTGDFKENLSAPIVIATLETYRNSLLGVEPNMKRMTVVYDEYHYLQDESRGSAWEESIILTPRGSQLVLLSASVPNAEDFAQWITKLTKQECEVVRVLHRPVPLEHLVFTKWGWALVDDLGVDEETLLNARKLLKPWNAALRRQRRSGSVNEFFVPIDQALQLGLGPIVVYAGRRGDAEGFAHGFARFLKQDFTGPSADKLRDRIQDLPGWEFLPPDLQRLVKKYGVAYHHSGMIPPGRVAIESLLKEGLLRVCAGTMGISLGVNFAVRAAFISDESRPGEGGETNYSNSEVLQMLGRAGRRGHDKQGFCLWPNLGRYALQQPREREPLRSSLKFDPTTVLGILGQQENLAYLSEFYRKSFFMRDKPAELVALRDHDLLSAKLYNDGFDELPCTNVVETYNQFRKHKQKDGLPCYRCPAREKCHPMQDKAARSPLQNIVSHLVRVGALEMAVPTKLGQLARHFPQAGGLIIADLISRNQLSVRNFHDMVQIMGAFCSSHYKKIPDVYVNEALFGEFDLPKAIQKFYPLEIFPDLYDDTANMRGPVTDTEGVKVFREFNPAAASLATQWLDLNTTWDALVADHASRFFSAGDCMMVLFRFSTFLQSCARLDEYDSELSVVARRNLSNLLRDPLDARNRMLQDDPDEKDDGEEKIFELPTNAEDE